MHLIIWFGNFSCRREAELTRLWLQDYDSYHSAWKVYDLKTQMVQKAIISLLKCWNHVKE